MSETLANGPLDGPWIAALSGFVVAGASALIAWLGLRFTASRPRHMIAVVLGGTMARLLLVATASIVLLMTTTIDPTIYMVSLLVCYLGFLAAEVIIIARSRGGDAASGAAGTQGAASGSDGVDNG